MNRKFHPGYALLSVYELLRVLFYLTSRPESSILMLPASWYAAVPLLALPVIFSYLARKGTNERFYYIVAKIAQNTGAVTYIIRDYPYAAYGALNGWYSLLLLTGIVLFSVIDAILLVVFLIPHKGKVEDADNSSSQR